MKKISLLLAAFLITVTFVKAQDGWVNHKGDDRVSIKFPATPTELTPGTFSALGDDSVAYIFTIVDFKQVANVDSAMLAPIKASPEFAAQLKIGIKQTLPDVGLSDFTINTWKGFTSYTSSGLDSKQKKYVIFMFIVGSKLYSASTISPAGSTSNSNENFVNSIIAN